MVAEPPAPLPRVATIEVAEPVQPEVKLEPPLAEPVPDAKPVGEVENVSPRRQNRWTWKLCKPTRGRRDKN